MTDTATADRIAGSWEFRPVSSSVDFAVSYIVNTFRGRLAVVSANFEAGVLSGSAEAASINISDSRFFGHLQAPDFFDAESHPEVTFASTSLDLDDDRVSLDGELTMRGVTRPIHAEGQVAGPTEDFMGLTRLGFTFQTTIDRTEFGMNWNAELPAGGKALSDDVELTIELEFQKASTATA